MLQHIFKYIRPFFIGCFIFIAFQPQRGSAADFSIAPVRIYFDGKSNTAIRSITNRSAEDLTLQLKTFKWEQDDAGKDVYSPTEDILFFPKIFKIHRDEEKIVRVGTKIPPGRYEKTYRMYLEELPRPQEEHATAVRILMRVGVPIFIRPMEEEAKGGIEKVLLQNGALSIMMKNEGNSHFIIRKINVAGVNDDGKEVFNTATNGGYLLTGVKKSFMIEMSADKCLAAKTLKITIDTDKLSLNDEIDISKEMCGP